MRRFEIPLTAEPQNFSIQLSGSMYKIRMFWDWYAKNWVFSLSDLNGQQILSSIPLVAGTNLLEQFKHLNLGGKLFAYFETDKNVAPDFNNIGSNAKVFWVVEDE